VKTAPKVVDSVRNAVGAVDLPKLYRAIEQQFENMVDHACKVRSALARLESGLTLRFLELLHG
jgi:hypothetical protein